MRTLCSIWGGKHTEDVQELLFSSNFISDEDWPVDFHMTLATTRDGYHSIRVEMQTTSETSILKAYWTPCTYVVSSIVIVCLVLSSRLCRIDCEYTIRR
jgi:hypothetical protein